MKLRNGISTEEDNMFKAMSNHLILHNVFAHLPQHDLLNCRLVSSYWWNLSTKFVRSRTDDRDTMVKIISKLYVLDEKKNGETFLKTMQKSQDIPKTTFSFVNPTSDLCLSCRDDEKILLKFFKENHPKFTFGFIQICQIGSNVIDFLQKWNLNIDSIAFMEHAIKPSLNVDSAALTLRDLHFPSLTELDLKVDRYFDEVVNDENYHHRYGNYIKLLAALIFASPRLKLITAYSCEMYIGIMEGLKNLKHLDSKCQFVIADNYLTNEKVVNLTIAKSNEGLGIKSFNCSFRHFNNDEEIDLEPLLISLGKFLGVAREIQNLHFDKFYLLTTEYDYPGLEIPPMPNVKFISCLKFPVLHFHPLSFPALEKIVLDGKNFISFVYLLQKPGFGFLPILNPVEIEVSCGIDIHSRNVAFLAQKFPNARKLKINLSYHDTNVDSAFTLDRRETFRAFCQNFTNVEDFTIKYNGDHRGFGHRMRRKHAKTSTRRFKLDPISWIHELNGHLPKLKHLTFESAKNDICSSLREDVWEQGFETFSRLESLTLKLIAVNLSLKWIGMNMEELKFLRFIALNSRLEDLNFLKELRPQLIVYALSDRSITSKFTIP